MTPQGKSVRNRVVGLLAALWGGALLSSFLMDSTRQSDSNAYAAGGFVAEAIFGLLLVIIGLFYAIKG